MATKKAVAKKQDTIPLSPYDEEDVGAGFEDFTSDDLQIPFINILQSLSHQVDEDDALYIKGAKPGMMFNSVTEEIFDGKEGIAFIPVHRVHSYIEWVPRDQGGGFVDQYPPNHPMVMAEKENSAFGEMKNPDTGNDLVDTFTVFGLRVMPDEGYEPVVISFSKTQIGPYRKWMSRAKSIKMKNKDGRMVTPPLFSHIYRLTLRQFENNKGKWYGWHVGFEADTALDSRVEPGEELYDAAKEFREMVISGQARAATESAHAPEDPDEM